MKQRTQRAGSRILMINFWRLDSCMLVSMGMTVSFDRQRYQYKNMQKLTSRHCTGSKWASSPGFDILFKVVKR